MKRLGNPKLKEREQAIDLREQGFTYSEILKRVPVAKSTLSVWLGSVGLSKKQHQRLTERKLAGIRRGGAARRRQRIDSTNKIMDAARKEIGSLTKRELWLVGMSLYWAEGSKEKENISRNARIVFSNSDQYMVRLFISWLLRCCGVAKKDIKASIYIHENSRERVNAVIAHWVQWTGLSEIAPSRVYYKKHNPKTNRQNVGHSYYGNVRIEVATSSILSRKTAGWIEGLRQI